jgi:hypothetical protein
MLLCEGHQIARRGPKLSKERQSDRTGSIYLTEKEMEKPEYATA